mgnify:CR=1 FL=1|jgi:hypothetical protein
MPVAAAGAALLGTGLLGVSLLLPWVSYGAFDFRLFDIPGWPQYLTLALAQEVAMAATLLAPARRHRTFALAATVVLGAGALAAAVVTTRAGQDPHNMFDSVFPAISPMAGPGSHAAMLAAIAEVAAAALAWIRQAAPREPAMSGGTPS